MNDFREDRFNALATYNAERARGILHSPDYVERMRVLQEEYEGKMREIVNVGRQVGRQQWSFG